jgi:hypothetical protein
LFGADVGLVFRGSKTHKTPVGGLFTLLAFTLSIIFALCRLIVLAQHSDTAHKQYEKVNFFRSSSTTNGEYTKDYLQKFNFAFGVSTLDDD